MGEVTTNAPQLQILRNSYRWLTATTEPRPLFGRGFFVLPTLCRRSSGSSPRYQRRHCVPAARGYAQFASRDVRNSPEPERRPIGAALQPEGECRDRRGGLIGLDHPWSRYARQAIKAHAANQHSPCNATASRSHPSNRCPVGAYDLLDKIVKVPPNWPPNHDCLSAVRCGTSRARRTTSITNGPRNIR
jgi:hypothetical protein